MNCEISLEIADAGLAPPAAAQMIRWVESALAAEQCSGDICLYVVGDEEMASLNKQYRGKDGPTNVLSFPAELPADIPLALLGDIVLCSPLIEREALEQGKTLDAHWAHLLVHGTLHLLGYDHEVESDAELMECREIEILGGLGFTNPYNSLASTEERS
jgi:probable rRNA maturation factor